VEIINTGILMRDGFTGLIMTMVNVSDGIGHHRILTYAAACSRRGENAGHPEIVNKMAFYSFST